MYNFSGSSGYVLFVVPDGLGEQTMETSGACMALGRYELPHVGEPPSALRAKCDPFPVVRVSPNPALCPPGLLFSRAVDAAGVLSGRAREGLGGRGGGGGSQTEAPRHTGR